MKNKFLPHISLTGLLLASIPEASKAGILEECVAGVRDFIEQPAPEVFSNRKMELMFSLFWRYADRFSRIEIERLEGASITSPRAIVWPDGGESILVPESYEEMFCTGSLAGFLEYSSIATNEEVYSLPRRTAKDCLEEESRASECIEAFYDVLWDVGSSFEERLTESNRNAFVWQSVNGYTTSILHEVGHLLLDHYDHRLAGTLSDADLEFEADLFAAKAVTVRGEFGTSSAYFFNSLLVFLAVSDQDSSQYAQSLACRRENLLTLSFVQFSLFGILNSVRFGDSLQAFVLTEGLSPTFVDRCIGSDRRQRVLLELSNIREWFRLNNRYFVVEDGNSEEEISSTGMTASEVSSTLNALLLIYDEAEEFDGFIVELMSYAAMRIVDDTQVPKPEAGILAEIRKRTIESGSSRARAIIDTAIAISISANEKTNDDALQEAVALVDGAREILPTLYVAWQWSITLRRYGSCNEIFEITKSASAAPLAEERKNRLAALVNAIVIEQETCSWQ